MSFTNCWRYGRLYSIAIPYVREFPSLLVRGTSAPKIPVTASGRRYARLSGRSPSPLPNRRAGDRTWKSSAPTSVSPTPPISQPRLSDRSPLARHS